MKMLNLLFLILCSTAIVVCPPAYKKRYSCKYMVILQSPGMNGDLFNGVAEGCCKNFEDHFKPSLSTTIPEADKCTILIDDDGRGCLSHHGYECEKNCIVSSRHCDHIVENAIKKIKGITDPPSTVRTTTGKTRPTQSPELEDPGSPEYNSSESSEEAKKNEDHLMQSDMTYIDGNGREEKMESRLRNRELDEIVGNKFDEEILSEAKNSSLEKEEIVLAKDEQGEVIESFRIVMDSDKKHPPCMPTKKIGDKYYFNVTGGERRLGNLVKDLGPWHTNLKYDEICMYMIDTGDCMYPTGISKSSLRTEKISEIEKIIEFCGWDLEHEQTNMPAKSFECNCNREKLEHKIDLFLNYPGCPSTFFRMTKLNLDSRQIIINLHKTALKICTEKKCGVEVTGRPNAVSIKFQSDKGFYRVSFERESKEGFFENEHEIDFAFTSEGTKVITGYCNENHFKRRMVYTTDEFCDATNKGLVKMPSNVYCKNRKMVNRLFIVGLSLGTCYMLSKPVAGVVSAVLALIIFCCTYGCLKRFYCYRCLKVKCTSAHACNLTNCPYCGSEVIDNDFSETERKDRMDRHIKYCRHARKVTGWYAVLRIIFRNIHTVIFYFVSSIPGIALGIVFIIILTLFVAGVDTEDSFVDKVAEKLVKRYGYNMTEMVRKEMVLNGGILRRSGTTINISMACSLEFFTIVNVICLFAFLLFIAVKILDRRILFCYYNMKRKHNGGNIICEKCFGFSNVAYHNDKQCGNLVCPMCDAFISFPGLKNPSMCIDQFRYYHIESHKPIDKYTIWENISRRNINSTLSAVMKAILAMFIFLNMFGASQCDHVLHNNEMKKVENDIDSYISDLMKSGFHAYHARFTGGPRERLSSVNEKKDCTHGKCVLTMEIEADLMVKPGKEFGYLIQSENIKKEMKFNIKILNPESRCHYKDLYKTGDMTHHGVTDDTCTDSCEVCLANARKLGHVPGNTTNKHQRVHSDSSSWACDGLGCLSIGGGCTCLECWCEMTEPKWTVKKLIKEEHEFELCLIFNGLGYCRNLKEQARDQVLNVLEFSKGMKFCPEMIACDKSICMKGHINDLGEDLERFGSAKLIGNYLSTREDIHAEEICHFGKHRYYTLSRCCHDTNYLKDELEHSGLISLTGHKNIYSMTLETLGSWKLRIKAPRIVYQEKIDKIEIKNLKITQCMGCHNCNEGGSCLLQFTSNFDHTGEFECDGCLVDQNGIFYKKGQNSIPFNVFCNKKEGNITCKLDNFKGSGSYRMKDEPRVPHGNGIVNVDITKNLHNSCEGFWCGFNLQFSNIWGRILYAVIGIVILIFVILFIYFLIKLFV